MRVSTTKTAKIDLSPVTDASGHPLICARYIGTSAVEDIQASREVYAALKPRLGGFFSTLEKIEPGALYFSDEYAVSLAAYLTETEFDLSERLTIGRKLAEYLAVLHFNGYTLHQGSFGILHFNPMSLDPLLYDLTLVRKASQKPGYFPLLQQALGEWFRTVLFASEGGASLLPGIVREILEKMTDTATQYRSFNGLFRDLSTLSHQKKQYGKLSPIMLDAITPIISRVRDAMRIQGQGLVALLDAIKRIRANTTEAVYLTGPEGIGKSALIERFIQELPDYSRCIQVELTGHCAAPFDGVRHGFNTLTERYVLNNPQMRRIFTSVTNVRFGSRSASVMGLLDERYRRQLGINAPDSHDPISIASLIDDIRVLQEIDPSKKVVVVSGFSLYDSESKTLIAALIKANVVTNTLLILTDEAPDEAFVRDTQIQQIALKPLTARDIDRLLRNVFVRHQFERVGDIAEQILSATDGLPNAIINVIDTAVQKSYFYQGIDERTWYCAPAFLKKEFLLQAETTHSPDLVGVLAREEISVVRAIAVSEYGASFHELAQVTGLSNEQLNAALTRVINSSALIKRRNEAYVVQREERAEILQQCPLRTRKKFDLRFIDCLTVNVRNYSLREYVTRIADFYLDLYLIDDESLCNRLNFVRAAWAGAWHHYLAGEIKQSRRLIDAALLAADRIKLYAADYELAKNLDFLAMQVFEKSADLPAAQARYRKSRPLMKSAIDGAELAHVYINILKAQRQFQEAFDVGMGAIAALGYPISKHLKLVTAMIRYLKVRQKLEGLPPSYFDNMPENTDRGVRVFHKLSAQLVIVCFQYHSLGIYVPLIILNSLMVSFSHGVTVELALSLMGYAYIKQMLPFKKKDEFIHGYYDIAKRILARFPRDEFVELFNDFVYYGILEPWRGKLPPLVDRLNERYQRSVVSSQPEIAGFFSGAKFLLSLESGVNVKELERSVELVLPEIRKLGQDTPITIHSVVLRTTRELGSRSAASYSEFKQFLKKTEYEHKDNATVLFSLVYCSVLVALVRREYVRALRPFFSGLMKYGLGASGLPYLARYFFYAYSSYARHLSDLKHSRSHINRMLFVGVQRLLPISFLAHWLFARWARMYPEKYHHFHDYVLAERWAMQPLLRHRAVDRFVDAFRRADDAGYRLDALIIGTRIHELRTKYEWLEFGDDVLEARVRALASASGIQAFIRAVGAHRRGAQFGADHFKPYTVDNIQAACAQAIKEIQASGVVEKGCVIQRMDEQLIEICRWEGDDIVPVVLSLQEPGSPLFDAVSERVALKTDDLDQALSAVAGASVRFRSLLPLASGDDVVGVLCLESTKPLTDYREDSLALVVQKLGLAFAIYRQQYQRERFEQESQRNHDYIAHINHEIRTPINGIVSLADKLQHLYAENPTQQNVKDYISHIASSARSLLKIHQDVSSLQEIESGRLTVVNACTDLHETLLTPFSAMQEIFAGKGLRLITPSLEGLPRYVMADASKISQILYNLLHNSYKYTEKGEVEGAVRFAVNGARLSLEIILRDTGVGIPKEYARRIKVKGATTVDSPSSIKGSGIGLSVISRFCELMGGDLIISSEVAEGATVRAIINLDIIPDPIVLLPVMKQARIELAGLRLLCVDDDDTNLMAYAARLQGCRCELLTARNGWEALDTLGKNTVDLVLMDYDMPGSNGVDTAARAREMFGEKCPPIICMSAYDVQIIKRRHANFEAVCNGFIEKIADNNAFIEIIGRWLGREVKYVENPVADPGNRYRWIDYSAFLKVYGDNLYVGRQLVDRFLASHRHCLEKVNSLLALHDRKTLVSLFHQLKGQANNVGAFTLANESHRMMTLADSPLDVDKLAGTDELRRFASVLEPTFQELALIAADLEPAGSEVANLLAADDLERELADIEAQLVKRSLLVMQKIATLIRASAQDASGLHDCLDHMGKAVQEGDFERARAMLLHFKETRHV